MQRGARRQSFPHWDDQRSHTNMAAAYLLGVLGAGIVIALALFVVMQTDWMKRVQTALHRVRLPNVPSVPSLPQAKVGDVFKGLTDKVGGTQQTTTTLWQRGSAKVGQANRGAHGGD